MDLAQSSTEHHLEVSPAFYPGDGKDKPIAFILMLWVPLGLTTFVVALRMYARVTRNAASWDDVFMLMSLISYFIAAGIASAMWRDGFGQHIQYIIYRNPQGLVQIAKIIIPVQIAITLGPAFAKISACIFILRMIKNARRAISWSIYVLIFILTVVALATCVTWLVQCIPLARFWDTSVQGTCIDRIVFVRVFQSYNVLGVVTDFACAILPISILKTLQMDKRRKIELYILMGMAMLPGIACLLKTIDTIHYADFDFSYNLVPGIYWVIIELSSGIIVASLPVLHGLLTKAGNHISRIILSLTSSFDRSIRSFLPGSLSGRSAKFSEAPTVTVLACPAECAFCRAHHGARAASRLSEWTRDKPLPRTPVEKTTGTGSSGRTVTRGMTDGTTVDCILEEGGLDTIDLENVVYDRYIAGQAF